MRFKYDYLTQGQLGQLFGVSSQTVGRWLIELGLRRDQRPTNAAHDGDYCSTAPSGSTGYHWVWHASRTVSAFRAAGHAVVPDLPFELVELSPLSGPFRISEDDPRNVIGAHDLVAVRTVSQGNSEIVLKLLEAADRTGALARLIEGASTL